MGNIFFHSILLIINSGSLGVFGYHFFTERREFFWFCWTLFFTIFESIVIITSFEKL